MSLAFRYRAATVAGELVEGTLVADDERTALDELRRQALVPVSLEGAQAPARALRLRGPSVADAVAGAMRTMAALSAGGAPLDRVLDFAARHAAHPRVGDALAAVRRDVQDGQSLATAMRARREVFGTMAPAMVRAGEESGSLDAALARLADHLERARALRTQLRDALLYPAILAIVSGTGVVVLLTFVVPRFVAMLADGGGTLPWSTRLLVGASHVVTGAWWLWLALLVGLGLGVPALLRDDALRRRLHAARLAWPVAGGLELAAATARFTRALAALLQGGAPLLASLRIAREGVDNLALGARLDAAIGRVERGDRLAASLDGVLPPLATQLLAVGEEGGALDAMAARAADTYDAEVQRGLRTLVGLVEPVLILAFGGLVGFVALAMLQAIYSINASVT